MAPTDTVDIVEATHEDDPLLDRLLQFYQYDFGEIMGGDVGADGVYRYTTLERFWGTDDPHAFIVRVGGRVAGFAFVCRQGSHRDSSVPVWYVDEFFVMRKYRRRGVGERLARHIFDLFAGEWEAREVPTNTGAIAFWRKVIGDYTSGRYEEYLDPDDGWGPRPVQRFRTPPVR